MNTYDPNQLIGLGSDTTETAVQLPSLEALMAELVPANTTSLAQPFSVYCHIALPDTTGQLRYYSSRRVGSFETLREAVGTARLYKRVAKEHGLTNLTYEVLVNASMLEGEFNA
jgi:hypothetical protein